MKNVIFIVFGILILLSCSKKKEILLNEYKKMYAIIKEKNFEKTYQILDTQSQNYLQYLADTSNWSFEKIRSLGKNESLEFTTLYYYYHLKSLKNRKNNDNLILLEMFGVTGVPLFNWFQEPELLEDKTKKAKGNNVIIGYDIDESTFVSTKVQINQNSNGEYKLNIFPLFEFNENVLNLQFKKYLSIIKGESENLPDSLLIEKFFSDIDNPDYNLNELKVKLYR